MDLIDFSDLFKTKAQANDFVSRLATIAQMTYHTDFNLEKSLLDQFGIVKKDIFITILRDNNIPINSGPILKKFFEKMQADISSIPLVPLTIAFTPTEQTLKTLSDWFLVNLNKQVLFNISVDHNLIAGAAITFNGKFLDFSIRAKFDQIVKTITEQITSQTQATPLAHQNSENMHFGR